MSEVVLLKSPVPEKSVVLMAAVGSSEKGSWKVVESFKPDEVPTDANAIQNLVTEKFSKATSYKLVAM